MHSISLKIPIDIILPIFSRIPQSSIRATLPLSNALPSPTQCMNAYLTLVQVKETSPQAGQAPLIWCLITNRPVTTAKQAGELIDWYRARWEISEQKRDGEPGTKLLWIGYSRVLDCICGIQIAHEWEMTDLCIRRWALLCL